MPNQGALRIWEAAAGRLLHEIAIATGSPSLLLASPDDRSALVAGGDGSYSLVDLPGGAG